MRLQRWPRLQLPAEWLRPCRGGRRPQPLAARAAQSRGGVTEVVADGSALGRAKEIAAKYLTKTEVTRRNTRIHFMQPIKERIVREVGYGLALEGASAAALVKSFKS